MTATQITATDFFCGMGGSSTGLVRAGFEVQVAANHWDRAIETHAANHPSTEHLLGDIQAVDVRYLPSTHLLWASPICTEVSPAGGRRRKGSQLDLFEEHGHVPSAAFERTRVTFWEVIRAAEVHRYPIILIENVVEAAAWELFDVWLAGMTALGYQHQFVSVSAAHVGDPMNPHAPQWRDRLYIVFNRRDVRTPDVDPRPLAFCPACGGDVKARQWWKKQGRRIGKYGAQYIYVCPEGGHGQIEPYVMPASTAIDWTDIGVRIGDRARPLAKATMRRIQTGLDMLERGDFDREFVFSVNHGQGSGGRHFDPAARPLPTETIKRGEALVVAAAGNTYDAASRGEDGYIRAWPADGSPLVAQTTTGQLGLVTTLRRNGDTTPADVTPLATMAASGFHHGLVMGGAGEQKFRSDLEPHRAQRASGADFLVIPYRKGSKPHRPDGHPLSAQATHAQHGVMRPAININDCNFRMLRPREAANAQAFPRNYVITGNQGEQQMQAGNAVATNVACWLGRAAARALDAA